MEDKKPCDDIFEGLAELLINNGTITSEYHKRMSMYNRHSSFIDHTNDDVEVEYGAYKYHIIKNDGEVVSIHRFEIQVESEDD